MRIGDPAYDFQWGEDYGIEFMEAVIAGYRLKTDNAFFRRLEFYEDRAPFHAILYGLNSDSAEWTEGGLNELKRRITARPRLVPSTAPSTFERNK